MMLIGGGCSWKELQKQFLSLDNLCFFHAVLLQFYAPPMTLEIRSYLDTCLQIVWNLSLCRSDIGVLGYPLT